MFAKTTNIYLYTDDGGLVLILRSPNDSNLPLVWETSGGHVDSVALTTDLDVLKIEALRELHEEMRLSLSPKDIRFFAEGSTDTHLAWLGIIPKDLVKEIELSPEHCALKVAYRFNDVPKNTRHQVVQVARVSLP